MESPLARVDWEEIPKIAGGGQEGRRIMAFVEIVSLYGKCPASPPQTACCHHRAAGACLAHGPFPPGHVRLS